MKARMSYEIFEPDHEGESYDCGVFLPGGWKYSVRDPKVLADIQAKPKDYELGKLRYVLGAIKNYGLYCGSTETYCDGTTEITLRCSGHDISQDYPTGYDICYRINISNISKSSVERVKLILEKNNVTFE